MNQKYMARSKPGIAIAAKELASLAEKHLGKLSPNERNSRIKAFDGAVAKTSDTPGCGTRPQPTVAPR
jgi:hypothetical protein